MLYSPGWGLNVDTVAQFIEDVNTLRIHTQRRTKTPVAGRSALMRIFTSPRS